MKARTEWKMFVRHLWVVVVLFCKNIFYLSQKLYVTLVNFWIWVRTTLTFFDLVLQTSEHLCTTNLNPPVNRSRSRQQGFVAGSPSSTWSHANKNKHKKDNWFREHFEQNLSSQNTRNGVSEHQDFKIFWGTMPPVPPSGWSLHCKKKHDLIYLRVCPWENQAEPGRGW